MTTSQFIKDNLNGVSAYRLSQLTGISTSLLSCYINSKSEPSVDKLKLIIKALDIHRDNLNVFFMKIKDCVVKNTEIHYFKGEDYFQETFKQ